MTSFTLEKSLLSFVVMLDSYTHTLSLFRKVQILLKKLYRRKKYILAQALEIYLQFENSYINAPLLMYGN